MPILDRLKECASRDALEQVQLERLQAVANRLYRHVAFFREHFRNAGMEPDDIETLDDLSRLPLTDRGVLAANHPYGLFAVPLRDIVRLNIASRGPSGDVVVGCTHNDNRHWTELVARALSSAGVSSDDVLQIAVSNDLHGGAHSLHDGAEALGATVMPVHAITVAEQIRLLTLYRVTTLVTQPSTAVSLLDYVSQRQLDPKTLFLKRLLLVGEALTASTRQEIAEGLLADVFETYGIPEVTLPGIATECEHHCGLHLSEDQFLAEVIDPETGLPVGPGEEGELVLTTLAKEGVPFLRYRTGDRTRLHRDPCPCGRTFARIERIAQRVDDLMTVGGIRFFPSQVDDLLRQIGYGNIPYRIEIKNIDHRDCLEILVGVTTEIFDDEMKIMAWIPERIQNHIREWLNVPVTVRMVEGRGIEGGPSVVDKRRP